MRRFLRGKTALHSQLENRQKGRVSLFSSSPKLTIFYNHIFCANFQVQNKITICSLSFVMTMIMLRSMTAMNSNDDDADNDDHKVDDGDDNDCHEVDDGDDNSNTMPRSGSTMSSTTKRRKYSTTSTGQISSTSLSSSSSSSSPSP